MPKAAKKPARAMTPALKAAAIARVQDGESKASVARSIGVPESTLRGWCKSVIKIQFQARQSSPTTSDESSEPRPRADSEPTQPFNLSVASTSPPVHAPSSEALYTPATFSNIDHELAPITPQNISMRNETPSSTASQERNRAEVDRNRAELARLSHQLGLNRQEQFPFPATIAEMTHNLQLLSQFQLMVTQHNQAEAEQRLKAQQQSEHAQRLQQARQAQRVQQAQQAVLAHQRAQVREARRQERLAPRAGSTSPLSCSYVQSSTSIRSPAEHQQPINDYVNGWLSSQEVNTMGGRAALTSAASSQGFYQLWKGSTRSILQQQLSGDESGGAEAPEQDQPENLSVDRSPKRSISALDSIIHSSNNNNDDDEEDAEAMHREAVDHGEKFLRYLDTCQNNPLVTSLQVHQFSRLLENVKSAGRRNGEGATGGRSRK